jgi:hypothetical protein
MLPHRVIVNVVHGDLEVSNILSSIRHLYHYFIINRQVTVGLQMVAYRGDMGVDRNIRCGYFN